MTHPTCTPSAGFRIRGVTKRVKQTIMIITKDEVVGNSHRNGAHTKEIWREKASPEMSLYRSTSLCCPVSLLLSLSSLSIPKRRESFYKSTYIAFQTFQLWHLHWEQYNQAKRKSNRQSTGKKQFRHAEVSMIRYNHIFSFKLQTEMCADFRINRKININFVKCFEID